MIFVLILLNASSSIVAAPAPPSGKISGTISLPPGARSVPADFGANARRVSNPKLDSAMADLAAAAKISAVEAADLAQSQSLRLSGNRVHVQIVTHARGVGNAVEAVTEAGGEVTGVGNDDTLIQGWLPLAALETVAAQDDVYLIRRPAEVVLLGDLYAGNTTEGLAVINGPAWHTAGYEGAGVKVGVIDGGFEGYVSLLGTELPASVTVKNFVDGESDADINTSGGSHGLACAEIIHDIAPDATLYLAKVSTNLDLAEAVAWLKDTHGVDIISTSLGWYNVTPGDGTGEFADLVQTARNAGIFWTTAASNDREAHWGGLYYDPDTDDVHNFNGTQEINFFGPGDGSAYDINPGYQFAVYVRWNDWTTVDQDYDLHLWRWNGSAWDTIADSENVQDGSLGQRPTEFAIGTTSGDATAYGFTITRYDSNQNVNFEIFVPKFVRPDEILHARSLGNLADAPDAMTVAALDVTIPYPQESYSSEGPANGPGGAETGGSTKPDISGFANVATESYEGSTFNGTSAATPHVAGAAALVLSANPSYTPAQLQSFLEVRAIDMGSAGMDTLYGYGRLYLGDPPSTTDPTVTSITPNSGYYTETVSITNLAGSNFQSGATVKLTKSGQSDINATLVNVASESQITCDFDLNGSATGQWNVVVTNPDAQSGTLPNGFTVKAPGNIYVYLPLVLRRYPPLPDTPVLNAISNSDGDGNYVVSWNTADGADTYILEEDDNASFSSPTTDSPTASTSKSITGQAEGTYYYRVKARNSWGDSGWSTTRSVTVSPPPPPTTIYPSGDAVVIQGIASTNFGGYADMWAGYDHCSGVNITRSLVKFDVSSIPAGTSITQATLYLYLFNSCDSSNRSHTVTAYRTNGNWSESSVTWNNKPGYAEARGSTSIQSRSPGWYSMNVTDLMRGWVNGSFTNHGLTLRGPESSGNSSAMLVFYTRESSTHDPYLSIQYAGMTTFEETLPAVEGISTLTECGPMLKDALGISPDSSNYDVFGLVEQATCSLD